MLFKTLFVLQLRQKDTNRLRHNVPQSLKNSMPPPLIMRVIAPQEMIESRHQANSTTLPNQIQPVS